jgi:hypothetical protein
MFGWLMLAAVLAAVLGASFAQPSSAIEAKAEMSIDFVCIN